MSDSEAEGPTQAQKEESARLFLKNQGIVSLMALLSLAAFINYPNAYVAIGCVLLISAVARYLEKSNASRIMIPLDNKAVLVTGCDTGIGHELAKRLVDMGVTVFAGCLHSSGEGATALRKLDNRKMHVVQMNVTKDEDVQKVREMVNKVTGEKGLWGLVNNAGVEVIADVELNSMEQYERLVQVNQLGMVRVTKAFLPLVRKTKGRVINVTSVKGRLPVIYDSAYVMTKFAAEAFSNILRMEMKKFGVKVVVMEPGNFCGTTSIVQPDQLRHDCEEMWKVTSPDVRQTYGKEYLFHHVTAAEESLKTGCRKLSLVTDKIVEALFTDQPKTRYTIGGSNSWYDKYKLRGRLYQYLPDWYMDGLWSHDTRDYPSPKELVGQQHSHSH